MPRSAGSAGRDERGDRPRPDWRAARLGADEALQILRGLDPAAPRPEPVARAAWDLETDGGRRHPLDVVTRGAVHPALKARRFKRRGRTWNRRVGDPGPDGGLVHVINLQGSRFSVLTGGSAILFHVNVGVCLRELHELIWQEPTDGFIQESSCEVRHRLPELTPGREAQMLLALEPDRTLEQQGEELARWIVDAGVGYLDRLTSLEAVYAAVADDVGRGHVARLHGWELPYLAAKAGDRQRAEQTLHALAQRPVGNRVWRLRLERLARHLDLALPPYVPPRAPTGEAWDAGYAILQQAQCHVEDLGPEWRLASTGVGGSHWPRSSVTFECESGDVTREVGIELTHYADAAMAEAQLPASGTDSFGRTESTEPIASVGDGAGIRLVTTRPLDRDAPATWRVVTHAVRVGPAVVRVAAAGSQVTDDGTRHPLTEQALQAVAVPTVERQVERLRRVLQTTPGTLAVQPAEPAPPAHRVTPETPPELGDGETGQRLLRRRPDASAWRLDLVGCAGLTDQVDVLRAVERLAALGLVAAVPGDPGKPPRPAPDLAAWVERMHHETDVWKRWRHSTRKLSRTRTTEWWGAAALRHGLDWPHVQLSITRYGRDHWCLSVWAPMWSHADAGVAIEQFATSWAHLLVSIVEGLRRELRPTLCVLYASDSYTDLVEDLERGAFVFGWRTWYGPELVERWGRDLLLGLPDEAELLGDGTVAHRLAMAPADMVLPKPGRYTRARPYLLARGLEMGWPRF